MPSVAAHEQASLAPELSNKIHVKFAKGSGVRLRNGKFATLANADLSDVRAVLQQFPGIQIERLFSRPELVLAQEKQRIEAKTGQNLPDLNLWYRLILPPGSNAEALVAALNTIPIVEVAYIEPQPAPPPASPNFEPQQGYLNAAPNGIDAAFAQTVAGGDGSGTKIIDVEYSWNQSHEDLSKALTAFIPNGIPCDPFSDDNHGTAVLGEIVATRNGFGVAGISFAADLGLVNSVKETQAGECDRLHSIWDLANSISIAHGNLGPGDVMLIEQQVQGPLGPCDETQVGCAPVEWTQANFDAIQTATADGIVVVEPAGNGATNLDDPAYLGRFDRSLRNSGAMIVGAGSAPGCAFPPHSRMPFSNYGGRVDLQGWGECVVTTGYGYLTPGVSKNEWYTGTFGGTSSASPIVAGAVAALQGINIQRNGNPLSPAMVRDVLVATGTPQDTSSDSGHIGPLPNLRAAATTTLISLTMKKSLVWTGNQAGPQDAGGHFWNDPAFDDSQWSTVTLPDTGVDLDADDRYYRSHFTWDGVSSLSINFATDDGLAIYVNGNLLGSWGNGWRQQGCVNGPSTCLVNFSVPAQDIPPGMLTIGDNVLAIELWNGVVLGGNSFYVNVNLLSGNPAPAATLTVTNTNDSGAGSLRQAISNAASGDTINFSLPVGSTITLTSGELVIEKNLTINGPGANQLTVSGNNLTRVFNIVGNFNVTLSGLTIANGQADDFGGGILNDRGTVNVTNSALSGNSAAISGGGIATTGTMNVTGSTLSGNSATFFGGGIHNLLGTVNVTNSTLSGNSGTSFGGGIQSDAGTVNVTNSTLSGNSATSFGGGISNSGALNVSNSTLSGNSAPTSGGIGNLGTVISKSTIIAGNTAGPFGADLSGFFTSQGYNLIGNADGSIGFENGVNNDQVGTGAAPVNPMLGTLANNGGPTRTMALLSGSPAIDKGGLATGVTTDQRGLPRPVDDLTIPNAAGGDGSDIGAFEVQLTPTPTISINDVSQNEGQSGTMSFTFNVTLSNTSSQTVTINFATADGTGTTADTDYSSAGNTLTFDPGQTSKPVAVLVNGDSVNEANETFFVNLTVPTNATIADNQGLGTIVNDDAVPALSINDAGVTEGNSGTISANFTVSLSAASGQTVTVNYATADGTATAGPDYQSGSGTLTFNAGETSKPVTVLINGDTAFETDETFLVNLTVPTNATIADNQGLGTIVNDDAQPPANAVQFAVSTASVNETLNATTKVDLVVTRSGDTTGTATVDYASADGTASERSDYLAALGTLRFAAGETAKSISVFIVDDVYGESAESFSVTLSNAVGVGLGAPATVTVTIDSNESVNGQNPVKDGSFSSDFFVREHYVDFFNREADAGGLAFWKNQIDECVTQECREIRRINVSAAFFVSIEFQQTGYLVYKANEAAFNAGEFLKLREFLPDLQEIGRGVVIGQPGAEVQLEANKQKFFLDFVQRAKFVAAAAYPTTMTAAQFVDKLNANTFDPQNPGAGALSQSERDALVGQLSADPASATLRAQVLRSVSENGVFNARQFNRAFVLMQYFGYLRRNPNDPQDTDYTGYDFWLRKLNEFNGNFVNADMVKAFIVSGEYRGRFGP
jgi:hypothetical protein